MQNYMTEVFSLGSRLPISELEILIIMILPALMTGFLFLIYKVTLCSKQTLFKDFQGTLFISLILSSSVSLIMLVIGNNLAKAFALLGIFSILRFRNTSKSMMPLLFIIPALVVGIITGMTFFQLAIQFGLFAGVIILLINLKARFIQKIQIASKKEDGADLMNIE